MSGWLIEGGVYFLLFFTPLAFGGVEDWAEGVLQIVVGVMTAAWAWGRLAAPPSAPRGAPLWPRLFWIAVALFLVLVFLQLVPLPPGWIGVLSPAVHDLYTRTVPGYAEEEPWRAEDLPAWLLERKRSEIPGSDPNAVAAEPPASSSPFRSYPWARRTLSIYPHQTRQRLITLACYLGLFASVLSHFSTTERVHRLLGVAALSAFAVSLFGIIQKLTYTGKIYWVRAVEPTNTFGPFVNRNSYAAFAGTMFPVAICLGLLALRQRRAGRPDWLPPLVFWSFISAVISGGILLSLSRGGMLSIGLSVVIIAAMLLYYGRRTAEIGVFFLMLMGCGGLLFWIGPESIIERVGTLSEGESIPTLATRIETWERSMQFVSDHLLLGTGLGTFRFGFMRYTSAASSWWRTAHDEYLELICDTGLVGGALFLMGLLAYGCQVAKPGRFALRSGLYLYVGLLSGIASLLVHSAISANLQVPANGMLLTVAGAALLGLVRSYEPHTPARFASAAETMGARLSWLARAALVILVGLNTYSGLSKVVVFAHRFGGEQAFARADLDLAHSRLMAAIEWQPDDASTLVLLGRVIQSAQANSLPLKAVQGKSAREALGEGYGAIAAGIGLNPVDAWGWFNLATSYQGYLTGSRRLERMRRAGEAAASGGVAPLEAPPDRWLGAEDAIPVAAVLQAIDLHPHYVYYDWLAGFYWRRGMKQEAGAMIGVSMKLAPQLSQHALLEDREILTQLAGPVLEGIERAAARDLAGTILRDQSRAEVLAVLGRTEEAIAAYDRLRAIGKEWVAGDCDLAIGKLEQERGRYRESIEPLTRLVEDGTWRATQAHYFLGQAHSILGDHAVAARHFSRFLAQTPDQPEGYRVLAEELDALGRGDEAESLCLAAVRKFPQDPAPYRWAISRLRQRGRQRLALQYALALGRLDPQDAESQQLILQIQHELERLPR